VQRIYFSNPDVKFIPATTTSPVRFSYKSTKLEEGKYQLLVNAPDANGNMSETPYQVSFKVAYVSSLLVHPPYPNPSQANIYFSATLTGEDNPDVALLSVYDIYGKPVYTAQYIPHIGYNEWAWPGTNTEGTDCPGGVYLYKVVYFKNGQTLSAQTEGHVLYGAGYGRVILQR